MDKIESVIASLTKRDEQLAAKRITAQKALDKAIKARQDALLSGDLDDQRALDKLQGTVDSATSALSGIDDALAFWPSRRRKPTASSLRNATAPNARRSRKRSTPPSATSRSVSSRCCRECARSRKS